MATKTPITQSGAAHLQAEINNVKTVNLPAANQAVLAATDDLQRQEATTKQRYYQDLLRTLESIQANSEVIDTSKMTGRLIGFGAKVEVTDLDSNAVAVVQIVSDYEASYGVGTIAISSPLARALLGKSVGDSVSVQTTTGTNSYEVQSIAY